MHILANQHTDQTLLVATYTMVTGVQIWRLNMQWIPSARDLDVGLKAELLRSLPFSCKATIAISLEQKL